MDDGVKWQFQLVDGITASANLMASALKSLEITLQHGDKSLADSHGKAEKETKGAFGAMGESVKSFAEGFFFVTEGIKTAWESVSEVLEKGIEGAKFVLEASDFKRNALLGLDAVLATGYEATDVLEKLEGWAKQTGIAKDTFAGFGKQLLGAGFKEGELKPLLGALSDVQGANNGQVAASQELFELLKRIRATDRVNERELAGFAGLGIKPDQIYAALAQQQHKSLAQAKALFSSESASGGVKGNDAINAILGAISGGIDKRTGGLLGSGGQAAALGSVPAQVQKLKDAFTGLFEGTHSENFAHALSHITAQLSGDKGKHFADSVSAAFDKLGTWVTKLDFTKIGDTLVELGDDIGVAAKWLADFFAGLKQGWKDVAPAIDAMGEAISACFGSDGGGSSDLKLFAESIGNVVGAVVIAGEVVVFALAAIGRGFVELIELVTELVVTFAELGTGIVEGLWGGIKSAWGGLISGFHALVAMLPESVKHVLGIASPSKVFAGLGVQTMQGFTVGMESVPVADHVAAMVNAPSLGSDGGGFGALRPNARSLSDLGGGGGGGSRSIQFQADIRVDGSKDPRAAAEEMSAEMRRTFLPALATAFDELCIEDGG